jgi:hypothetical protein
MALTIGEWIKIRHENMDTQKDPYNVKKENYIELNAGKLPEGLRQYNNTEVAQPAPELRKTTPVDDKQLQKTPVVEKMSAMGITGYTTLRQYDKDIQSKYAQVDKEYKKTIATLNANGKYADYTGFGAMLDPRLYAKSVIRIGKALGVSGAILFAAQQFGLFVMNSTGKIWNPLTTIGAPAPLGALMPAAADVLYQQVKTMIGGGIPLPGQDMHYDIAKGKYNLVRITANYPFIRKTVLGGRVGTSGEIVADSQRGAFEQEGNTYGKPLVDATLNVRNQYFPKISTGQSAASVENSKVPVDTLIQDALSGQNTSGHLLDDLGTETKRYSYNKTSINGETTKRLTSLMDSKVSLTRPDRTDKTYNLRDPGAFPLYTPSFNGGIIPAKFQAENSQGFILTGKGEAQTNKISDNTAYLPFSLTDLRPVGGSHKYRTVYFRPLNLKLNESFVPRWNKSNYYGRVDAVATYEATDRSIGITFDMHAFSPEDLKTIYQKLHWLNSMLYPSYNKELIYQSGPVIRVRVGDVINALGPEGCRGLPGIIESVELDYSEGLWELEDGIKVPRSVSVSMQITILHDKPIGIGVDGKFGGMGLIGDDGKYVPPSMMSQAKQGEKNGANANGTLPEAIDASSFRSIQRIPFNDWDKIENIDKVKSNTNTKKVNPF